MRKAVKKSRRYSRFLKVARKRGKLATAKFTPQPSFERLAAVIQKAQAMDAATLTQKFFKRLTFSSLIQQDITKTIFLSRLRAAHLKLSTLKSVAAKAPRCAKRTGGVERLALKAARTTNNKRRELAL